MSGTDLAYAAPCYAMSGTNPAYGATRSFRKPRNVRVLSWLVVVPAYAMPGASSISMPGTHPISLRARYTVSRTDQAYAALVQRPVLAASVWSYIIWPVLTSRMLLRTLHTIFRY
eukprot:2867045-Rhodomonas_salina.11